MSVRNQTTLCLPDHLFLGRTLTQLLQPPALGDYVLFRVMQCAETRQRVLFQFPMRNRLGVDCLFECECLPCRDGQVAAFLRDITLSPSLAAPVEVVDGMLAAPTSVDIVCCGMPRGGELVRGDGADRSWRRWVHVS